MTRQINYSVGEGGRNLHDDVLKVQELLNIAHEGKALTLPRALKIDGIAGPRTNGAIGAFQSRQCEMKWPDRRVDPGGKTLTKLLKAEALFASQSFAITRFERRRSAGYRTPEDRDTFYSIRNDRIASSVIYHFARDGETLALDQDILSRLESSSQATRFRTQMPQSALNFATTRASRCSHSEAVIGPNESILQLRIPLQTMLFAVQLRHRWRYPYAGPVAMAPRLLSGTFTILDSNVGAAAGVAI